MATETLGSIYNFNSQSGFVIPDTLDIRSRVEAMMREVFGVADLDVTAETPMGRMIEALTILIVDFIGINALNANNFNPSVAVGRYLDNLGNMFGVPRNPADMSDAEFRKQIMAAQSRGMGFVQSIRQALLKVQGVTSSVVFENGHAYPIAQPDDSSASRISIDPHSIYVCVGGLENYETPEAQQAFLNRVAVAILGAKSAGCAYTDIGESETESTEYGTKQTVTLTDSATGSINTAIFYTPNIVSNYTVVVTVDGQNYTGSDIVAETKSVILEYLNGRAQNCVTTAMQIASQIGSSGSGISCVASTIMKNGTAVEAIALYPSQRLSISANAITVNIA